MCARFEYAMCVLDSQRRGVQNVFVCVYIYVQVAT